LPSVLIKYGFLNDLKNSRLRISSSNPTD
jgi:hypothetical protein